MLESKKQSQRYNILQKLKQKPMPEVETLESNFPEMVGEDPMFSSVSSASAPQAVLPGARKKKPLLEDEEVL